MLFTQAAARPAAMPVSRFFSQTSRRANEEREIVEEATKAAEEGGSTSDSLNSLESASQRRSAQDEGHTLFVSNMSFDATDMHLREAFGKYGDITSVNIGRDGRGLSRGYVPVPRYPRPSLFCTRDGLLTGRPVASVSSPSPPRLPPSAPSRSATSRSGTVAASTSSTGIPGSSRPARTAAARFPRRSPRRRCTLVTFPTRRRTQT